MSPSHQNLTREGGGGACWEEGELGEGGGRRTLSEPLGLHLEEEVVGGPLLGEGVVPLPHPPLQGEEVDPPVRPWVGARGCCPGGGGTPPRENIRKFQPRCNII